MTVKEKEAAFWEFFQGLSKTFMLPVALLAFMGVLLGLGSFFSSESMIETVLFLGKPTVKIIFQFISTIGGFAFAYLPTMFAMAIPLGLVREGKGVAAFSGFAGYAVMNSAINFYLVQMNRLVDPEQLREAGQGVVFGIQTVEMGILGGIIAGPIAYKLHNRFHTVQLPNSFTFFSGTQFVPIITSLVMAFVDLVIPLVWPFFVLMVMAIGQLIQRSGIFGPFLFGSGERLLLPFGLYHISVSMIRFTEVGSSTVVTGKEVFGVLNIFYAESQNNLSISLNATAFLSQGKMPTFVFGLPAVAPAIYHTAAPANRHKIKGLLLSGVIAMAITGVTEPIEFLFLFISPLLWLFHVIMTGLGFVVMALLGVVIGNTDGGLLDFAIFGSLQGTYTKWWWVLIVDATWFAVYYFVFKTVIVTFDLKAPGRDKVLDETEYTDQEVQYEKTGDYDTPGILAALDGQKNIQTIDNYVTRLRLVLADTSKVDDDKLKQLGALGVVHLDTRSVQVVIEIRVTTVRNQLEMILG